MANKKNNLLFSLKKNTKKELMNQNPNKKIEHPTIWAMEWTSRPKRQG
jgi:hypothetical protein